MTVELHKYCLALDLKDDPEKIDAYIKYHKQVWPEINQSIKASGIQNAEIYHTGNRLFMILEVDDTFSFEKKASMDGIKTVPLANGGLMMPTTWVPFWKIKNVLLTPFSQVLLYALPILH